MIYAISDIHSCYTKFISNIPSDASKIIILGDLFNKGIEQEEMLEWAFTNYNNKKYVFLFGNHEVRMFNEVQRGITSTIKISSELVDAWYESDNNRNISNIVIDKINRKEIDIDFFFGPFLKAFKWYHVEKTRNYLYYMSHASWEFGKLPAEQNKRNLVYDTTMILNQVRKKDNPQLDKYAEYCKQKNIRHVFGHFVCPKVFGVQAPYINRDVLYFIDNGIYKKANKIYFHKVI